MDEFDDPHLQNKISKIRETLQRLGTSFSDDENSELESPFEEKQKLLEFEQNLARNKSHLEKVKIVPKTVEANGLEGNIQAKLLENSAEIGALRTVNAELQTQIDLLHSTLHKKEKEINRLVFANELQKKTEEELKKALHEFKIQEEIAKKEMHQLRRFSEITESDKSQIAVALSDAKKLIDRLQKALKSKDSFSPGFQKGHQKREFELDAVPSPKFQIEPGKIDFNRLKIPERLGTSSSPERFEHHFTDRGEELQYRHICEDAMKIVGCTSPKDFHSKLIHLRHHHSKYKKVKSLIDRISEMIVQCSPEGMFRTVPTVRQIWRWITKLLEEYMNVKQSVTGQALLQLYQMMGTDSLQEVVRKVEELRRKQ